MISKTIKWFCTQIKIAYKKYDMDKTFGNWHKFKTSYLFRAILMQVADLGDMLIDDKTYSKYDRINKLTQISVCCMMLADKLKDEKE